MNRRRSIKVFRKAVIGDRTLQPPFTIYGGGKLFGELLGRYYNRKYGIDFRSIRLRAISPEETRKILKLKGKEGTNY